MEFSQKAGSGKYQPSWGMLGETVCGASHLRNNRTNQDALKWLPAPGGSSCAVMSASDGHGSARHFRSNIGAQLAVDVASAALIEFMETHRETENLSVIKGMAEEKVAPMLHRRWKAAVNGHLAKNPFTEEELTLLQKSSADLTDKFFKDSASAYGCTLLSVLVTPTYALLLQLGDGDILTVTEQGEVQRPLPDDARLFAEETTSFSMQEAWREFRICFQALSRRYPALFLITTDGYINSFPSDDDFCKVGCDILNMFRENGLEDIRNNLPIWLKEASHMGSGDDVTLGIVFRKDIVHNNQIETEGS